MKHRKPILAHDKGFKKLTAGEIFFTFFSWLFFLFLTSLATFKPLWDKVDDWGKEPKNQMVIIAALIILAGLVFAVWKVKKYVQQLKQN